MTLLVEIGCNVSSPNKSLELVGFCELELDFDENTSLLSSEKASRLAESVETDVAAAGLAGNESPSSKASN